MKRSLLNLMVAGLAIFATGCKEDTVIKANLVPDADKINIYQVNTDTLTILTRTEIIDTLNTSANIAGIPVVHGLGTVTDPYFGKTSAGIYLQVAPTTNQFSFPAKIDSAFLIMPYIGFKWGDTTSTAKQRVTVYRTESVLEKGKTYYSNYRTSVNEVVSKPFDIDIQHLGDYVTVLGQSRTPHVRIPLDMNSKLLQELQSNVSSDKSVADFITYLRGLYVEPDTNQMGSAIPYFYLSGSSDYRRASIEFFYFTDSVRSVFFNFDTSAGCAHYNRIKRDDVRLNEIKEQTNTMETIAIQNEPGAAIDIIIPNIKSLPLGLVNKATLEITQLSTGVKSEGYTAPTRLVPYLVDANGNLSILDEASGYIDGNQQPFTTGGIQLVKYQINIANTTQKAISNKWDELHLRITGAKGFPGAYRLIAGGSKNSNPVFRTKLTLFYSKPR